MKIQIKNSIDSSDYREGASLHIDGICVLTVVDLGDCPEDANLSRDLNFFYSIPDYMKRAYDAGVKGEPFEMLGDISIDWEELGEDD